MADANFDFLASFIHQLLDDAGFAEMSEEVRKQFVPQFTMEAERRLGLALLPLLKDKQMEELMKITNDKKSTPETYAAFWQKAVPDFQDVVDKTMQGFAAEFKKTLSGLK